MVCILLPLLYRNLRDKDRPVRPADNGAPSTVDGGRGCFLTPLEDAVAEGVVEIEGEDDAEPLTSPATRRRHQARRARVWA